MDQWLMESGKMTAYELMHKIERLKEETQHIYEAEANLRAEVDDILSEAEKAAGGSRREGNTWMVNAVVTDEPVHMATTADKIADHSVRYLGVQISLGMKWARTFSARSNPPLHCRLHACASRGCQR
jgi:hypothetical protein